MRLLAETEKSLLDAVKAEAGKISSSLYELIVDVIPIASVEAVIIKDDSLLFLRRNNNPVKGQLWFPGVGLEKEKHLRKR